MSVPRQAGVMSQASTPDHMTKLHQWPTTPTVHVPLPVSSPRVVLVQKHSYSQSSKTPWAVTPTDELLTANKINLNSPKIRR